MIENLLGRSGANIERSGDTVTKTIARRDDLNEDWDRLRRSAYKQASFVSAGGIRAPRVHTIDRYSFTMHYVNGRHVGNWTAGERLHTVRRLMEMCTRSITCWITWPDGATDKLAELVGSAPVPRKLSDELEGIKLPAGPTHGDLTLCNVLLDNVDQIWLLDFDSPFMESPALDAAKLLQDALLGWYAHVLDIPFEPKPFDIIDMPVWLMPIWRPLLALHVLRIWPYARDERDRAWIRAAIQRLGYT